MALNKSNSLSVPQVARNEIRKVVRLGGHRMIRY